MSLPVVIASTVVRAANKGDRHGGIHVVDLEKGTSKRVIDWSRTDISWAGRGGDRGLRGVLVQGEFVYMAASDELFVCDRSFRIVDSFRNRYLKLCHEICTDGARLYLASTGYDSVLRFDPSLGAFDQGISLRGWTENQRFPVDLFDPRADDGPRFADTVHLNNVQFDDGSLHVSGSYRTTLVRVDEDVAVPVARIPGNTHNVQLYKGLVLFNHTAADCVALADRHGLILRRYPVPTTTRRREKEDCDADAIARVGFGRGLCRHADGVIVAGASPARVSAYRIEESRPVSVVCLSEDPRDSIHGLAVW